MELMDDEMFTSHEIKVDFFSMKFGRIIHVCNKVLKEIRREGKNNSSKFKTPAGSFLNVYCPLVVQMALNQFTEVWKLNVYPGFHY